MGVTRCAAAVSASSDVAGRAIARPRVEVGPKGVDRTQLVVDVPLDGHALALLPALHRLDVTVQVGRDFLPRIQPVMG